MRVQRREEEKKEYRVRGGGNQRRALKAKKREVEQHQKTCQYVRGEGNIKNPPQ